MAIIKKVKSKLARLAARARKAHEKGKRRRARLRSRKEKLLTSKQTKRLKSIQPAIGGLSMAAKASAGRAFRANIRRSSGLLKLVKTATGRAKLAKRIKEVQPILKGRKEATKLIRKGISVGLRRRQISKTVQTAVGRRRIAKRIAELAREAKKRR